MAEILATMIGRHGIPSGACDAPQGGSAAWCIVANGSFDETPHRLDGIEIVRIGRQPFHGGAALFDEELHLGPYARGGCRAQRCRRDPDAPPAGAPPTR